MLTHSLTYSLRQPVLAHLLTYSLRQPVLTHLLAYLLTQLTDSIVTDTSAAILIDVSLSDKLLIQVFAKHVI